MIDTFMFSLVFWFKWEQENLLTFICQLECKHTHYVDMLPHIINQFALKSETIVETKFHTVQTYQGPDICWDAIKIPVFGALALLNLSRLYLIPNFDFGKILTWHFQNFFDCRGNHMRSESVNWWFHFDGSGILSTRHTTRLFTLVNEACIELMVPFTFRRSVTGAAPLGL